MYSDSQFSDISQTARVPTAARLSLSNADLEERELANIQSAMAQSYPYLQASRAPHLLQFPYDSLHFQPEQIASNYRITAREQGITEDSGMTYYEDRPGNLPFSFKHQMELAENNLSGPFLTQELERLHMVYGTEQLFDKNYLFQRELSA